MSQRSETDVRERDVVREWAGLVVSRKEHLLQVKAVGDAMASEIIRLRAALEALDGERVEGWASPEDVRRFPEGFNAVLRPDRMAEGDRRATLLLHPITESPIATTAMRATGAGSHRT